MTIHSLPPKPNAAEVTIYCARCKDWKPKNHVCVVRHHPWTRTGTGIAILILGMVYLPLIMHQSLPCPISPDTPPSPATCSPHYEPTEVTDGQATAI